jgi:hypothetical protein
MKNVRFAAVVSLLTGCSLINSLDSVKPAGGDDAGHGKGSGGKGSGGAEHDGGSGGASGKGSGGANAGGAGGMGTGGEAPDSGSGGGGGTGGRGTGGRGTGGAVVDTDGGDAGPPFVPGGPGGVIVAYDTGGKKLHVLDPKDGHALSSEVSIRVLAIANDPITDNWYIFRQAAKVTDPVELVVRQLNTTSGAWHTLGSLTPVPGPALPSVGVLNGRIAYLSTPKLDMPDQTTSTFSVINTTTPSKPVVISNPPALEIPNSTGSGKVALLANADGTNVGGTVTIAIQAVQAQCSATECPVSVMKYTINSTSISTPDTPKAVASVSPTGGSVGFAFDYQSRYDVLLTPPISITGVPPAGCTQNSGMLGAAVELLPSTHTPINGPYSFDIANFRVSGAAFDSCHQIAFATSLLGDTAIWSIPMVTGGTPSKLCTAGGGALLFEPYTHALLRIPTAGDRIEAYEILDTTRTAPTLSIRTMRLPAGFGTGGVMAVRQPLSGCIN